MSQPTKKQITRWRQYLANERAEASVYRELARRREGEEQQILLKLAEAESRHEQYWHSRLGEHVGMPLKADLNTRVLGFLARNFGSLFVLALMQTAETRTPYADDQDAPDTIAADEQLHAEVVRGLAAKGRERMSGSFRAAVFGANDGLVSNVALILGVLGSGMGSAAILLTGISGLLAGAFSMAAGEYISVRSQSELLDASTPHPQANTLIEQLDVDENELELVFRARGLSAEEAEHRAEAVLAGQQARAFAEPEDQDSGSGAWTAAISSFVAFAGGAFIPIIPFIFSMEAVPGGVLALVLASVALLITGSITGLVSGKPPLTRALRQLAVGLAAALITFALGLAFGRVLG